METEIVNRLGNSFSRAPLAAVVGLCTAVAIFACFPLGELLFFHMLLIKKGITTYEYVVAMRAMSEAPDGASVDEEIQNVLYSPTGSATTGFSGGSSLGLPYRGVWCTPPRVFDNQDEVIPHLDPCMVPSTVDPDAPGSEKGTKALKRPVKRNAWKLAKLDPNEAARAAARARASSSVLRPIDNRHLPDNDLSSIGTVSIISSVSTDANVAASKEIRNNDLRSSLSRNSFAPSQGSRDEYDTGSHGMSNLSSPSHVHESVTLAPLPQNPTIVGNRFTATSHHMHSTFDDKVLHRGNDADPLFLFAPATSHLRDVRKTSVVWDPEAGRYVSAPVTTTSEVRNRLLNPSSQTASTQNPRPILPAHDSSSGSSALRDPLPLHQAERRLTYTGDSIFYGGPLINIPTRDTPRSGRGLVRDVQDRLASTVHRDARIRRDSTSNQLPVFAPGGLGANSQTGSNIK
jgi:palmitoyltransferase